MRNLLSCVLAVGLVGLGCTEQHLSYNARHLVPTLIEIQKDQIANNLVRFHKNLNSFPVQVVIGSGSAQITDSVTPTLKMPWENKGAKEVDLAYTGQWTENWSLTPVTDGGDLSRLRYLYGRAVLENTSNSHPTTQDVSFLQAYPYVHEKDQSGNPTASPVLGNKGVDWPLKGKDSWLYFTESKDGNKSGPDGTEFLGEYEGTKVWVNMEGFTPFMILIAGATSNTSSGGSGATGGGPKPTIYLPAIQ